MPLGIVWWLASARMVTAARLLWLSGKCWLPQEGDASASGMGIGTVLACVKN